MENKGNELANDDGFHGGVGLEEVEGGGRRHAGAWGIGRERGRNVPP